MKWYVKRMKFEYDTIFKTRVNVYYDVHMFELKELAEVLFDFMSPIPGEFVLLDNGDNLYVKG